MAQGDTYATFIASELDRERKRRENINGRAERATTAAGALVTLTVAVVVAIRGKDVLWVGASAHLLQAAVGCLLLAAVLGVFAGFDWSYHVVTVATLRKMRTTHWTDTEIAASNAVAEANILGIDKLRRGNNVKSTILGGCHLVQMTGLGLLAGAFFAALS